LSHPAALSRVGLGEKCGSRLDPCTALQSYFDLAYNQEREIVVLVGQTETKEEARMLALKYKNLQNVQDSFSLLKGFWDQTLRTIEIKT
ncbi:MAG: hypothetical protein AABY86_14045, partial [Bdellovibrionota bacterium]